MSGYDVAETTDENLERVSFIQKLATAYLKSALYPECNDWEEIQVSLAEIPNPQGKIESK